MSDYTPENLEMRANELETAGIYNDPQMLRAGAQAMRDLEAAQSNRRTPGTIEVCKKCHATLAQFKKFPCAKRECPLKQVKP